MASADAGRGDALSAALIARSPLPRVAGEGDHPKDGGGDARAHLLSQTSLRLGQPAFFWA